ncbi:NCS2 family permease [Caldalkalibacillus salinus]|uniref:NCS2 family permease n=1 Tax=Caldalkalibacillus salinus TaxID=2803787 RepID=UPI001F429229|nr:NCS2 family permease [Caldalkalibacillus salinus]
MLDKIFRLEERGTSLKTETVAGMTTFLTMVYIVIVNPAILSQAGVPFEQVFMATIISAAVGTLYMALFANYPIAIAPGMGLNAYFASVVGTYGLTYQTVFAAVFCAGVLFILLSLTSFREHLIKAIPGALKYGITSGIGLFIAFIGLRTAGLIQPDEATVVAPGDIHDPGTMLAIIGLIITLILMTLKVKAALFIGMLVTALIGYVQGLLTFNGLFSMPSAPVFFDLDFAGVWQHGLYAVIFAFLLVTLFDTTGTMIGVAEQAGLLKDTGEFPKAKHALMADAVGTTVGAGLGTSPTSAYIESSSGVAVGGRTGLTAVTTAGLLLLAMFLSPMIEAIAALPAITAPVLIIVGSFMMESVSKISWDQFDEAFPAFTIMIAMPLTSSIATGIALGFIIYPILKITSGKWRQVHPLVYAFGVIFALQMIFFPVH